MFNKLIVMNTSKNSLVKEISGSKVGEITVIKSVTKDDMGQVSRIVQGCIGKGSTVTLLVVTA
jgi:hypothetical protein